MEDEPRTGQCAAGRKRTNQALTVKVERENALYIALCPEFDVASQGTSAAEARANLQEALDLFLEHSSPGERNRRYRPAVESRYTGPWVARRKRGGFSCSR